MESRGRDPLNQFKWLRRHLALARDEKQKVLLVSHVAPGAKERKTNWCASYQTIFEQIVEEHQDVIVTQMYGDHNRNELRVMYDAKGKAISSAFIMPGIPKKPIFSLPVDDSCLLSMLRRFAPLKYLTFGRLFILFLVVIVGDSLSFLSTSSRSYSTAANPTWKQSDVSGGNVHGLSRVYSDRLHRLHHAASKSQF